MPIKNNRPECAGNPTHSGHHRQQEEVELPVKQVRVIGGVIRPVDQQDLAINAEDRRLRDVATEYFDRVTSIHRKRRTVLTADHDRLRLALPEVLEAVANVVQPWGTRIGVTEPYRLWQTLSDVHDPALGEDHRGTHMVDVAVAQGHLDHR